jgi:hypothetical protein
MKKRVESVQAWPRPMKRLASVCACSTSACSLTTAFALFSGIASAQEPPVPFAAVPQGSFPCYASEKDQYDTDAKRVFALEIVDALTYRVVGAQTTPHGRYAARAMKPDEDLSPQFSRGGFVSLQEPDGAPIMIGFYGTAYDGRPYFLLKLRDRPKVWVRCGDGTPLTGARPRNADAGATAAARRSGKLNLPSGAKVGAALEFGRYECVAQRSKRWSSEKDERYTLALYPTFEYAIDKPDRPVLADDGDFTYAANSGALDISVVHQLPSGGSTSDRQTVFYRDAAGTPAIAAFDDYPTRCRYAGKNTEASLNDKPRCRYATAPGKGIQPAQLHGIAHSYETLWTVGGLQPLQKTYLLLKDGSAMRDPPVPPGEIDVEASRKHDPTSWGAWKRKGDRILVKLHDDKEWTDANASHRRDGQARPAVGPPVQGLVVVLRRHRPGRHVELHHLGLQARRLLCAVRQQHRRHRHDAGQQRLQQQRRELVGPRRQQRVHLQQLDRAGRPAGGCRAGRGRRLAPSEERRRPLRRHLRARRLDADVENPQRQGATAPVLLLGRPARPPEHR